MRVPLLICWRIDEGYRVRLVDRTGWPCGADIRLRELCLALTLTVIVGRLLVLAVFVLYGSGRRCLSIVAAVLRLHMGSNTVHIRWWSERLCRRERDLSRASRGLNVERELVM